MLCRACPPADIRRPPPYRDRLLCDRGSAWDSKGDYDRAIADLNEALRLNPKSAASASGVVGRA